jgi:tetratricopeptide (TPR) repeat protein
LLERDPGTAREIDHEEDDQEEDQEEREEGLSMSRVQQLMKLHEVDPADADVLYMLAQEHAKRDEQDDAVAWFDRCLAIDALYCYAYFHKARSLEALGRLSDARETLLMGMKASSDAGDAKAHGEIAGYLESLGA